MENCEFCKTAFTPDKRSVLRGRGRFCSRKCFGAARKRPLAERFWEKVDKSSGPTGCWIWTGALHANGRWTYGMFSIGHARATLAHRIAYELTHGKLSKDVTILHKCDNPPCVNPAHLIAGTQADNVMDMMNKRRHWSSSRDRCSQVAQKISQALLGEKCPSSVLNTEQVRDIKSLLRSGERVVAVAEQYGVAIRTVYDIRQGRTWAHV